MDDSLVDWVITLNSFSSLMLFIMLLTCSVKTKKFILFLLCQMKDT
uniref:Uncharacterized protein n=1 Tax=Arundo donax TaxID=35708 RepID=A0A0A9H657_ARUDO